MRMEEIYAYQTEELNILREFRRVCDLLGLRYYLTAGTLLGAVRHQGFIPWDDDIDVAMPKADYELFSRKGYKFLSEEYLFQDYRTEPNFPYYFAKIRKRGTKVVEPILSSIDMAQGIYIDIFPLDICPDRDWTATCFFKGIELLDCAVLARVSTEFVCGYEKSYMRFAWNVLRRLPNQMLFGWRNLLCRVVAWGASGQKLCTAGGRHGFPQESYLSEWFQETVYLDFEKERFPAPAGWDELLKNMYGDYMCFPPLEEREQHFTKRENDGGKEE